MPKEEQHLSEKSIAQNELTLAALREPALKLLQEGRESSFSSEAKRTDKGLQVNTVDEKTKTTSLMIVDGNATAKHRSIDFSGFHFDVQLKGDFNITHIKNNQTWVEKDSFELKGSDLDDWMQRSDKFNVTMKRSDANGRPIQVYEPAISEAQSSLDPNGQPIRLARPAGNEANCGKENIYNPGNKRMECDYIIRDALNGDLSYNETREKFPASFYYRSVVRDMQGQVKGIVHQSFNLDTNGDLVSVKTRAVKPAQLRKQ
ncbi:MAG: hypothetical protein K2X27_09210 [Candidatus Obscuribacterales bacterium]|nr:hypothetical protein [Candidatus Obscuribacterales bacterium]